MNFEQLYNRQRSALIYCETSLELLANAAERNGFRDLAIRARIVRDNVLRLSDVKPVVPYETVRPDQRMVLDPEGG